MKYIKMFEEITKKYVPSKEEAAHQFEYMMLNRLQSDCEYFLNYGCGSERVLPSKDVEEHISRMKELWNKLPVKPEWLTYEQIEQYEKDMLENRIEKINRSLR
jgi:hypothetical protein